ncbi:MAG: polysaccharide pyruvyl transferase family protein [Actinomycetota bacterium]|nr:polysaccharide pyruvyl transferase family protein [Actinomycetota bacterium]
MPKVVIFGGFGMPNVGDELILQSLANYYSQESEDWQLTAFGGDTSAMSSFLSGSHRIRMCNYLNEHFWTSVRSEASVVDSGVEKLLTAPESHMEPYKHAVLNRALREADVFHIAGGGYLHGGIPHLAASLGYCFEVLQASNPSAVVIATGLTWYGMEGHDFGALAPKTTARLHAALAGSTLVDLRDDLGLNKVERLGMEAQVTCDDLLLWRPPEMCSSPLGEKYALLQVGGSYYDIPGQREVAISSIAQAARLLESSGIRVLPISFCPVDGDSLAVGEVLTKAGIDVPVIEAVALGAEVLSSLFAHAMLGIGTRLHFAVLCHLVGTPVFSIRVNGAFERLRYHYGVVGADGLDNEGDLSDQLAGFVSSCIHEPLVRQPARQNPEVQHALAVKRAGLERALQYA